MAVADVKAGPGDADYAATKTGASVISEGVRQEVKPRNIRTTVLSPASWPTPSSSPKMPT